MRLMQRLASIETHLAWRFESVLPGRFRRNKRDFAHTDFPILAPLPLAGSRTRPLEGGEAEGPFLYFVVDGSGDVQYVGKSEESCVLKRWIRPGTGGPSSHYWSHATRSAGCIKNIEAGLRAGHGPFELRFQTLTSIEAGLRRIGSACATADDRLAATERALIRLLAPPWNAA